MYWQKVYCYRCDKIVRQGLVERIDKPYCQHCDPNPNQAELFDKETERDNTEREKSRPRWVSHIN